MQQMMTYLNSHFYTIVKNLKYDCEYVSEHLMYLDIVAIDNLDTHNDISIDT